MHAGINTDGIKVGSNADMLSPFKDLSAEQVRGLEKQAVDPIPPPPAPAHSLTGGAGA